MPWDSTCVATQTTSTNQHSVLLVGDASGAVRGVDLILILRIRCKDRSRQSYAITKGGTGAGQNSFECEDLGLCETNLASDFVNGARVWK